MTPEDCRPVSVSRRIAWEPVLTAASREEDRAEIGDRAHHQWIYELTPDGPDATIVTETYDCTGRRNGCAAP